MVTSLAGNAPSESPGREGGNGCEAGDEMFCSQRQCNGLFGDEDVIIGSDDAVEIYSEARAFSVSYAYAVVRKHVIHFDRL